MESSYPREQKPRPLRSSTVQSQGQADTACVHRHKTSSRNLQHTGTFLGNSRREESSRGSSRNGPQDHGGQGEAKEADVGFITREATMSRKNGRKKVMWLWSFTYLVDTSVGEATIFNGGSVDSWCS